MARALELSKAPVPLTPACSPASAPLSSQEPAPSKATLGSLRPHQAPATLISLEEHEPTASSSRELILQKVRAAWAGPCAGCSRCCCGCPRTQLLGDAVSGLLVGVVAIPQSISYSLLAHQDPVYGIYTNFFCDIIYAPRQRGLLRGAVLMVGRSVTRHLRLAGYGDSSTALGDNSSSLRNGTEPCDRSCYAITVALSLSFLVGLYQVQTFTLVLFPPRNVSEFDISKCWVRFKSPEKRF